MKISTKGRYGVRAMYELALRSGGEVVITKVIAEQQGISEKYLEQILTPLRKAGLVRSVRGAQGGYQLARAPETITVGDIVRVLEGPIQPVECVSDTGVDGQACVRSAVCPARRVWQKIGDCAAQVLDSVTLADLVNDCGCDDRRD